ncbi:MAG: 16S rRNA (adenine(1518)-N(6)/adenine(1519)-N(6))-dimethyltransferase RsmA, partial [Bacteroidota bacterium]
ERITQQLNPEPAYSFLLEIGPGTGILTDYLLRLAHLQTYAIELDQESLRFLKKKYPKMADRFLFGDFLEENLQEVFGDQSYGIIGNFPYNISSQIFFRVLQFKDQIPEIVCMLQKEVAERIVSPPRRKSYGILSVFLQAYYDCEYLFTVEPDVFHPPPKVRSGVIRLQRNEKKELDCDEKLFRRLVKQGFNNRRKTLRNALKPLNLSLRIKEMDILNSRAEELDVDAFVALSQEIQKDQESEA